MLHGEGCTDADDRPPVNAFHDEFVLSLSGLTTVCGRN